MASRNFNLTGVFLVLVALIFGFLGSQIKADFYVLDVGENHNFEEYCDPNTGAYLDYKKIVKFSIKI